MTDEASQFASTKMGTRLRTACLAKCFWHLAGNVAASTLLRIWGLEAPQHFASGCGGAESTVRQSLNFRSNDLHPFFGFTLL